MWLKHVQHHWQGAKNAVGHAWHQGGKVLGAIDEAANLGIRAFGAVAPLLGGSALSGGVRAIDQYSKARSRVQDVAGGAQDVVGRLRAAGLDLYKTSKA